MMREQTTRKKKLSYLPYKQLGIDLIKKKTRNRLEDSSLRDQCQTSAIRLFSKTKSDSFFEIGKQLKKMTLSNRAFFNYMNKYSKLTQNFTFKIPSIKSYPRKKKPKYLQLFSLQKISHKNDTDGNNDERKNNNNQENIKNNELNIFEYKYVNKSCRMKEKDIIRKKSYGFKYKDTKIILDKTKIKKILSLFQIRDSNINITNIIPKKKIKKRININLHTNKEEKKKSKIFNYFYEGDFLHSAQTQRVKSNIQSRDTKNKNNTVIINDYDINNNIQLLNDMIKDIKTIKSHTFKKTMKYDIKKYYKKEDFSFQVDIDSICLKFMNQDKKENNKYESPQKLYLPFEYLPLFYLLDYTSFKVFLSEIIYFNKKTNLMEINQNEVVLALNKYKKFITLNVINQDSHKKGKIDKITYYCKEKYYHNEYDWIVYINHKSNPEEKTNKENKGEGGEENYESKAEKEIKENKKINYKVKIILPIIKFQIINRKTKIKKYLNKNLLINLIKNNFENWEEKVLCELFMNKKVRNIMNSLGSNKQTFNFSFITKKIFIDKEENKENILNKTKYEFFISNTQKDFSHYLYYSPYSILVLSGKEKGKKFFSHIQLNIKESINLKKYSQYWGYLNTLNKCLIIDKNFQKVHLDLKILEQDPTQFFYLKTNDNYKYKYNNKNRENLRDLENKGILRYKNNEDLEMSLLNCSIVEIEISQIKNDKNFYKVPKNLLEIFLSEKIKDEQNLNIYINEYLEAILFNDEIYNLKGEEINLKRKALNNDGMDELEEEFSPENNHSILPVKTMNKLNAFKASPIDRYYPVLKKGIGSLIAGISFIKRSETKNEKKINIWGIGKRSKIGDKMYKNHNLGRNFDKKFTAFHKKRDSEIIKSHIKEFSFRNKNKSKTEIPKVDKNNQD